MKHSILIILVLLATLAANTRIGFCQQPNPPSASPDTSNPDAHAVKIRHQLEYIGIGRDVTIRLRRGRDYHGRIVDAGDESFRIDEVDLRQVVSISYRDIKRVDRGYMEKSLIGNTRRNPHTSAIISLAVIGGLAAMILLVAHSIR